MVETRHRKHNAVMPPHITYVRGERVAVLRLTGGKAG